MKEKDLKINYSEYNKLNAQPKPGRFVKFFWSDTPVMYDTTCSPIKNLFITQFVFRIFALCALIFTITTLFIEDGNFENMKTFSVWGISLTAITFLLLILNSTTRLRRSSTCHQITFKTTLMWFEVSMMWNVIITVIFWSILYKDVVWNPFGSLQNFNIHTIHIFPILFCMIDYCTNVYLFRIHHLIIVNIVSFSYVFFNMVYTLKTGDAIYPMLTFEGWDTVMWIGIMLFFSNFAFIVLWKITTKRNKTSRYKELEDECYTLSNEETKDNTMDHHQHDRLNRFIEA